MQIDFYLQNDPFPVLYYGIVHLYFGRAALVGNRNGRYDKFVTYPGRFPLGIAPAGKA